MTHSQMPPQMPPKTDDAEWRAPAQEEAGFWSNWIRTRRMRWKEGGERKTDPDAPFAQFLPGLDLTPGQTLDILDTGSGPLSWVGTTHPDFAISVTAVDPLADDYNAELHQRGVQGADCNPSGLLTA